MRSPVKRYDIRGRLGIDFDETVAHRIAQAFARVTGAGAVVLAREDVRWMVALLAPRVQAANAARIARDLGLSENTVRVHVAAIFAQLGVNSRSAALLAAQRLGLSTPQLHDPL